MSSFSSSSRGISQTTTKNVVPVQTQRVQISTGDAQLDTALQRLQTSVSDPLDNLLSFINARFVPVGPTAVSNSRKVTPDQSTLARPDGFSLQSLVPIVWTFPSSLLTAGGSGSLGYIALAAKYSVVTISAVCLPAAGSFTLSVAGTSITPTNMESDVTLTKPYTLGKNEDLLVTYTANSSFSIPASVISLTLYVGVLT